MQEPCRGLDSTLMQCGVQWVKLPEILGDPFPFFFFFKLPSQVFYAGANEILQNLYRLFKEK